MLISKTVKIRPLGISYKHYKNLGYNWNPGEYIEVSVTHLLKRKNTNLKKYGVECPLQLSEFKQDIVFKKYGVNNISNIPGIQDKIRKTKEEKQIITPYEKLSEWLLYKRLCAKYTSRNKKQLFLEWNGMDYYDNEYVKNNLFLHHLNKRYPTIDHKISVLYGFLNNITAEEISNIKNLCITKRGLNSSKQELTENEFKKELRFDDIKFNSYLY